MSALGKVLNRKHHVKSNFNIKARQLPTQNILLHQGNQIQTAICKPHNILQARETSKRH